MSKRWDKDEKSTLIKLYSSGKTFEEIGQKLDRSESAVRLRLQFIVYDGIVKGMTVSDIAGIFKNDADTVKQMFYAYRSFKEGRGESVVPIDAVSKTLDDKSKAGRAGKTAKTNAQKNMSELIDKNISDRASRASQISKASRSQDAKSKTSDANANKLIEQNEIMEAIINNRELKKQIKMLYKQNKLTEDEKRILESVLTE